MQNRMKSRKYFSINQYQNFRKSENFNIKHLRWSKAWVAMGSKKQQNKWKNVYFSLLE